MIVAGRVKRGAYFDSVTLMTVRRKITALAGVTDAAVVMASPENREILADSGLPITSADDLADAAGKVVAAVKEAA